MTKCTLAILSAILLTSCRTNPILPPNPPGLKPHVAPQKHLQVANPSRLLTEAIPTFSITNITVLGGQVSISWTDGTPPYQVEGEPTLAGPWSTIGPVTMRHSATFPQDQNNFFRVQGAINLLNITSTNPTTLSWTPPQLDMSDTLTPNKIQRRYTAPDATGPNYGLAPDDDRGWDDLATVPAGQDYTDSGSGADPSVHPVIYYREREVTANGVFIPVGPTSVSGMAPVTPGKLNWIKSGTMSFGGSAIARSVAATSSGWVYAGALNGTCDFGKGTITGLFGNEGLIVGYDNSGNCTFSILAGSGCVHEIFGVAVDTDGFIVVVGYFSGSITIGATTLTSPTLFGNPVQNIFVAKYDAVGNPIWAKKFGGTVNNATFGDVGYSLAINSIKEIFFLSGISEDATFGTFSVPKNDGTMVLCKLDVNGTALWAKGIGGATAQVLGHSIAIFKDGNLAVAGELKSGANLGGGVLGSDGMFVGKFSSVDGSYSWANATPGSIPPGVAWGVAADQNNGNLVFTGQLSGAWNFGGPAIIGGLFLAVYNTSGVHQGSVGFNHNSFSASDIGYAVAVSPSGDITFTGQAVTGTISFDGNATASGSGVFTASFKSDLTYRWQKRPSGTGQGYGRGIASTSTATSSVGQFSGSLAFDGTVITEPNLTSGPFAANYAE